jgi:hypothetical protein
MIIIGCIGYSLSFGEEAAAVTKDYNTPPAIMNNEI